MVSRQVTDVVDAEDDERNIGQIRVLRSFD